MESLTIADRVIADNGQPLIIAEIGNNHDADLDQAMRLIGAAAEAGADAVKFQTYHPDRLVNRSHPLYDFFRRYAIPLEWHERLRDEAEAAGLIFLSTPFDPDAADFLVSLGVPALKIASSDLTNIPFVSHCAAQGLPLLLSTGMANLDEIACALQAAREAGCDQLAVLHCVSLYPTPAERSDLAAIPALKSRFSLPVGFSDHSLSATLPVAAVALGARIVEKHFTLDRSLPGPDHAVALEPDQFAAMAAGCREAVMALGSGDKQITDELQEVRRQSLRGLYAAVDIQAGSKLVADMVLLLRPAAELSHADLPSIIGRIATRPIRAGEPLSLADFQERES